MASEVEPATHIAGAALRAYQLNRSDNLRDRTINAFAFLKSKPKGPLPVGPLQICRNTQI